MQAIVGFLMLALIPAAASSQESRTVQQNDESPALARLTPHQVLEKALEERPGRPDSNGHGPRDSLWNGAAIGAGIGGASMVVLINVPCSGEGGACPFKASAIAFGIGAAIGMGVGALVDAAFSVSPILTDDRRGVRVSIVW